MVSLSLLQEHPPHLLQHQLYIMGCGSSAPKTETSAVLVQSVVTSEDPADAQKQVGCHRQLEYKRQGNITAPVLVPVCKARLSFTEGFGLEQS